MKLSAQLIQEVERSANNVSRGGQPIDVARAIACAEAGVVPLQRVRGHFQVVPIPGGWSRDPWHYPARDEKTLRRDTARFGNADAVGVVFQNGQRFLVDPATRRVVRFVEFADGSFRA